MTNITFFSIRAPNENGKGDQIALFQRCMLLCRNPEIQSLKVYYFFGTVSQNLGSQVLAERVALFSILSIFMFPWLYFFKGLPLQSSIFYSKNFMSIAKSLPEDEVIWVMTLRLSYLLQTNHISVMDFIDPFSVSFRLKSQRANFLLRSVYANEAKRLHTHEHKISLENLHNIMVSQEDQKLDHLFIENTFWLPLYLKENLKPRSHNGKRKSFVFHGTLSYAPNEDSVIYLLTEILPHYRQKYGECKVRILGRNPSKKLVALTNCDENVELVADCENIFDELQSEASIYVAPLRLGSGMQNKLLEAASLKIPLITSNKGALPLGLTDHSTCLIASSTEEYASNMHLLMNDTVLADNIAEEADVYVKTAFGFHRVADRLKPLLESI